MNHTSLTKLNFDYEQFINSLNETAIISVTDLNGKILLANAEFCKISGYSEEELLGEDHRIVNSGLHSKDYIAQFWQTIQSGKTWQGQFRNKNKNGGYYWVYSNVIPIRNKQTGEIEKYLSVRFDISDQKKAEEKLLEEQKKIQHLDKLSTIGEMAASIAHEVNNPLSVVMMRVQMLQKKIRGCVLNDADENEIGNHFEKILYNIVRIRKIIKNIKEISRKDTNEKPILINIKSIIDLVFDFSQDKLKSVSIQWEDQSRPFEVFCIPSQIEQVLINLLNNSIYAIKDQENPWIKIETLEKEDFIELSITDSGNGIPKEVQEKLMTPFYSTKPAGEGTGLGLSISKKMIEAHGGRFYYDAKSTNTRFVVVLPKTESSELTVLDLDSALDAHLKWNENLLKNIAARLLDMSANEVGSCDLCELGKWISSNRENYKDQEVFQKLIDTHSLFHKELAYFIAKMQSSPDLDRDLRLGELFLNQHRKRSNELIQYLEELRIILTKPH